MFIFVQFPIADMRLFVEAQTGHLPLPLWPSPRPYQEFIRSFGMVRIRGKGGIQGWIGENEICDAKHAIKIDQPIFYNLSNNKHSEESCLGLKCASRHFYFDGMAVAKFEFVFVTIPVYTNLSPKLFSKFILDFLKTKVEISIPQSSLTKIPIAELGKYLSRLYLYSTTKKSLAKSIDENWAVAGDPIFWIEFSEEENLPLPPKASLISSIIEKDVVLYHWNLSQQKNKVKNVWLAKYLTDTPKSKESSRTARIMLTRLNAEHETLWAVLKMIDTGSIEQNNGKEDSESSSHLQHYFNEATRRVFRLQKSRDKYFEPSEIGSSVRRSLEDINPGRRDSLLQKLQLLQIRPQVERKIRDYINQIYITENIMGDKVMGDKYNVGQAGAVGPKALAINTNFHNTTNMTETDIDLKQLAEELKQLREEMKLQSNNSNHDIDVGKVAIAEEAAINGERSKALETLKSVGGWTLSVAEKIGVTLATTAIKSALGI